MNEERKKLELEILKLDLGNCDRGYNQVINFILEDRKRICAPLIALRKQEFSIKTFERDFVNAFDEVFKLAGLEDGK